MTYLTVGDESGEILHSDELHKVPDVIGKPGGRILLCITGIVASGLRVYRTGKDWQQIT